MPKLAKVLGQVEKAVERKRVIDELLTPLQDAAKKANLDPDQIKVGESGMVEYPESFINPLSEAGAGQLRYDIGRHNDTVLGTDTLGDFGSEVYHGGGDYLEEAGFSFDPAQAGTSQGHWFAESYDMAENYGDIVKPFRLREGKRLDVSEEGISRYFGEEEAPLIASKMTEKGYDISPDELKKTVTNPNFWEEDNSTLFQNTLLESLEDLGYQSLKIDDSWGFSVDPSLVAFKPEQIRSVDAAFDPQFKGSRNLKGNIAPKLLAGIASASTGAMVAPLAHNAIKDPLEEATDNITQRDRDSLESYDDLARRSSARQQEVMNNFSAKRLARKAAKAAIGTGEAALTIGSGLANESAAGLAGLYGAATGQNPADIIQHFQENPSLYLPQTEEGMQLEGLQGLIDDTAKYWGPRGGTQAIQNFKQSQDYLNTQGAKIDPSLGAGMATALGLLPEVL